MMGDASIFIKFDEKETSHIMYGDNTKGEILGEGVVRNSSIITIEGVLLVKGLKHNLLSISLLCDKEYYVVFNTLSCLIEYKASKDSMFKGSRIDDIYILDLDNVSMLGAKCLVTKSDDS